MNLSTLLAALSLTLPALADGTSIVAALTTVESTTTKLGTAVSTWKGDLLGTLPIITDSTTLLVQVKKGTKTAEQSAALNFTEALNVATATNKLVASVNTTMGALIGAKHKFDKLLLSPVILLNLELQKKATGEMSEAIIAKVPAELQEVAKGLVAPVEASFELAIDEFNPLD